MTVNKSRSGSRLRRSSTSAALVAAILGFMLISTVRMNSQDSLLSNARESDLVVLLDSLSQRITRLQAEQSDLIAAKGAILQGSDKQALARTREQLLAMQILNGAVPVHGPGVRIVITDPSRSVTFDVLVGLVQEVRDAGAEAIEINGVRLNGRSYFGETDSGRLTVNGVAVNSPLVIKVIGDPKTLSVAVQIPGGVRDTVASLGARMSVREQDDVVITTTVPTTQEKK